MEYDVVNFELEVIEQSRQRPQVVDFWAPWCQPCQILGPVLERLASQANGQWDLKKVNVDENQDLAAKFGVKGIPAVKLIVDGEIKAEFSGALPEPQIKQWLKQYIPDENDEKVNQAKAWMAEGKQEKAEALLESVREENAQHSEAAYLLSKLQLFKEPEKSKELLSVAQKDPQYIDEVYYMNKIADLLSINNQPELLPEAPVKPKVQQALKNLAAKDFDGALQVMIEAVMTDKNYHNDLPREACIAIFKYLGDQDETTRKYRRRFDMALY